MLKLSRMLCFQYWGEEDILYFSPLLFLYIWKPCWLKMYQIWSKWLNMKIFCIILNIGFIYLLLSPYLKWNILPKIYEPIAKLLKTIFKNKTLISLFIFLTANKNRSKKLNLSMKRNVLFSGWTPWITIECNQMEATYWIKGSGCRQVSESRVLQVLIL